MQEYLSAAEAARFIGLAPATLATWRVRKPNAIPFIKAGRRVIYSVADLRAWMSANRRASNREPAAA